MKIHVRHLKNECWPDQLIIRSMMRSMLPGGNSYYYGTERELITKELIWESGSLKGVPGFYEQSNDTWSFSGQSGLLIPLYDHIGNLYWLRLRLDHSETDEKEKAGLYTTPHTMTIQSATLPKSS